MSVLELLKSNDVKDLIEGAMKTEGCLRRKGYWRHALTLHKTKGQAAAVAYLMEKDLLGVKRAHKQRREHSEKTKRR